MKKLGVAILATTLSSALASAGDLSFMTNQGQTSLSDTTAIASVSTFNSYSASGDLEIGLIIKDQKGRSCSLESSLLNGVDPIAMAFNLKNNHGVFVCKVDKEYFPKNDESSAAVTYWVMVK